MQDGAQGKFLVCRLVHADACTCQRMGNIYNGEGKRGERGYHRQKKAGKRGPKGGYGESGAAGW